MGRECKKNTVDLSRDDLSSKMEIQKRDFSFLYPLLLGSIAFFMAVGFAPLNPTNAGWILGRLDPTQHYLGWLFYRNGEWSFPVGLNPLFGQDLSSSIVYSDSIPLLAIPFKLLGSLLPERFHYFGIWLFSCFLLQAWLAWKILSLYSQNITLRLLGCGLFIFFPPMLWRINTPAGGHAALVGHFLILWALYLILKPSKIRQTLLWVLILSISVLTHFYIFAIVVLLWVCDLGNRYFFRREVYIKQLFEELLIAFVFTLFLAWQAGYFAISASLNSDRGFGFYGMNVLGLIDPQGWSYVLGDRTNPSSWGEGFSYLGLGAITAGIFALISLFKKTSHHKISLKQFFKNYPFLGFMVIVLTVFAVSNRVGVGDWSFTYYLPEWALKIADALRSSARMFWPIQYLLIISFFVAIARAFSTKVAIFIMALCFVLQVVDTSKGWLRNREQLAIEQSPDLYKHVLSNSFWNMAPKYYKNLTLVPSMNRPPNWENFAIYAASYGLNTNAVHMARIDLLKQEASNARLNQQIDTGAFDKDTLYVIENRFVIAALATAPNGTAIAKIDTFNVVAPNWLDCGNCPLIDPSMSLARNRYASKLGEAISFTTSSPNRSYYLREGWSWSEDWGTWSDSKTAVLNFSWPINSAKSINIKFDTFVVKDQLPAQEVDIKVNGVFYKKLISNQVNDNEVEIVFTPEMKKTKFLEIEFDIPNSARPIDLFPDRPDQRKLGVGVRNAVFR